jgi:starch-binding outer membrane protein, SusD/RagB family
MKYLKIYISLVLTAAVFALAGCQDLAVDNVNQPSAEEVLGDADDLEGFLAGQYYRWWNGTQKYDPPMLTTTMANAGTSSWGNFGMYDMSDYPRSAWNNDPAYVYIPATEVPWGNLYTAISSVNDVLRALNETPEIFENWDQSRIDRMHAFSLFVQGISYAELGNFFDQAFVVDWDTEVLDETGAAIYPPPFDFSTYREVVEFGVSKLDEAIAIAENSDFELPSSWIRGNPLSSASLAALAKTYKTRYMVTWARTTAERENEVDWQGVADTALDVIESNFFQTRDPAESFGQANTFSVQADGELWWSGPHSLASDPTWNRANYEHIGRYDQSGRFEEWIEGPYVNRREFDLDSADERIGTDFVNVGGALFNAARGEYHFSKYLHVRNRGMYDAGYVGAMQHSRLAEVALYRAEALLRLNPGVVLPEVVELINETRVERGGLPEATVADGWQETFNNMRYEFEIEMFNTAGSLQYYYRRSIGHTYETSNGVAWGGLIEGTPLHFPVPAEELDLLQLPYYTHGGDQGDVAPKGQGQISNRLHRVLYGQDKNVVKQ